MNAIRTQGGISAHGDILRVEESVEQKPRRVKPFQPCPTSGTRFAYLIAGKWTCLEVPATGNHVLTSQGGTLVWVEVTSCP